MKFLQKNRVLVVIFLIGAFLRFYDLASLPVGLHGDEASIGYNAYSILRTGHDQDGNFLPIVIDQFGDFAPAGKHYFALPFVALLGLNELAVRLPAAIFGSLSIIALYLFIYALLRNKTVALLSSFLLAFSPWSVNLSRASSYAPIETFFILIGSYLLLHFTQVQTKRSILLSFLCFVVAFFTYHTSRIFVPLFLPPFFVILWQIYKLKKKAMIFGVFYVLLLAVLAFFVLFGHGLGRASQVSIFSISPQEVEQQIGEMGKVNPLISRFFHNKLYFYGRLFLSSYSFHYGLDFLFVNNGQPNRYRVPWTGNLYIIELPFILLGFAFLLIDGIRQRKYLLFVPLIWFFLGGIPAGMTIQDIPNIERAALMVPAICMIGAYGFANIYEVIKKTRIRNFFLLILIMFVIQNISYFLLNYFYHSRIDQPWYRNEAEKFLLARLNAFGRTQIIMSTDAGNNLIFYLFYNKYDPALFQRLGSPREKNNLKIENITYTYDKCPSLNPVYLQRKDALDVLYVDRIDCELSKNSELLQTITYPDGIPVFRLVKLTGRAVSSVD